MFFNIIKLATVEIAQSSWQEDQSTDSYILHIHWIASGTQYFYIFFIPWQFKRWSLLSNGLHMMGSDANHENNQKILLSHLDGTSHNDISHPLLNLRRNQNYHSSTPKAAKDMREVYYFPFLLQSSSYKVTQAAIFCSSSRRVVVTLCTVFKREILISFNSSELLFLSLCDQERKWD